MSRVALVALGAVLAMQCVLAQRRPGATNQAVEQSSMVITFYNSGERHGNSLWRDSLLLHAGTAPAVSTCSALLR